MCSVFRVEYGGESFRAAVRVRVEKKMVVWASLQINAFEEKRKQSRARGKGSYLIVRKGSVQAAYSNNK